MKKYKIGNRSLYPIQGVTNAVEDVIEQVQKDVEDDTDDIIIQELITTDDDNVETSSAPPEPIQVTKRNTTSYAPFYIVFFLAAMGLVWWMSRDSKSSKKRVKLTHDQVYIRSLAQQSPRVAPIVSS